MYKGKYNTKSDYRKGSKARDGRNGNEFAITSATKYNSYERQRQQEREAAQQNEANRAWMVEHGYSANDADLMFA